MTDPASPPVALAGVELPDTLFAPPSLVPGVMVRGFPHEVSVFTSLPIGQVLQVGAEVSGQEPSQRRIRDTYYDTEDRTLFRRGISARLRQYLHPVRPIHFELVCVALDGRRPEGALAGERENAVLVQSFERNTAQDLAAMEARYAAAGLRPVAWVEKERTRFQLHPLVADTQAGSQVAAADVHGVRTAAGDLAVIDEGLRLYVDHLKDDLFPEAIIIEVEFDPRRRAEAGALIRRLRRALGPSVREKRTNKIVYLLGGGAER